MCYALCHRLKETKHTEVNFCVFHSHYDAMNYASMGRHPYEVYTERLFVRVNDKDESKFSIISFQNGESRGFIILIHVI